MRIYILNACHCLNESSLTIKPTFGLSWHGPTFQLRSPDNFMQKGDCYVICMPERIKNLSSIEPLFFEIETYGTCRKGRWWTIQYKSVFVATTWIQMETTVREVTSEVDKQLRIYIRYTNSG